MIIRPLLCGGLLLMVSGTATAASPERIVTLAPNLAELTCAAGGCRRLVGVSAYTDAPPQAAGVRQVGDAYAIDPEAVLAVRPDLVLAWAGGTPPQTIAQLRRLGLRVEVPRICRLDGVATALRRIGGWLGTEDIANLAARRYRRRLNALRARYAGAEPLRVFYQLGTAPAYTVNRQSIVSDVLSVCGGHNVFAGMNAISGPVSAEAVLARAPQVVLYDGDENRARIDAYWSRLSSVPAARYHALYPVDGDRVARASPRVLQGIRQVCARLDAARAVLEKTRSKQLKSP